MTYTVVKQSGVRCKVFSILTGVPSSTEIEPIRQFPNPDHFRGFHAFTLIRVHLSPSLKFSALKSVTGKYE
jgi:hypothetical protein